MSKFYVSSSSGWCSRKDEQSREFTVSFQGNLQSFTKSNKRIFRIPYEGMDHFAPDDGRRVDLSKVYIHSLRMKACRNSFPITICLHFEGVKTESSILCPPCYTSSEYDEDEILAKDIIHKQSKTHWEPLPFGNCIKSGTSYSYSCHTKGQTLELLETDQLFNFHTFCIIMERLDGKDWMEPPLHVPKGISFSKGYKGEVSLDLLVSYKYLHYYS